MPVKGIIRIEIFFVPAGLIQNQKNKNNHKEEKKMAEGTRFLTPNEFDELINKCSAVNKVRRFIEQGEALADELEQMDFVELAEAVMSAVDKLKYEAGINLDKNKEE